MLATGCPAFAIEPVPVRRDGRVSPPKRWRAELTVVPRLMLALPRQLVRLVGLVVGPILDWQQRERVIVNLIAAFTWRNGTIGVRPAFRFSADLVPFVGIDVFHDAAFRSTGRFSARLMTSGSGAILEAGARPTRAGAPVSFDLAGALLRRDDLFFQGIRSLDSRQPLPPARFSIWAGDLTARVAWHRRLFTLGADVQLGARTFGGATDDADEINIRRNYCRRLLGYCVGGGEVDDDKVPGFNRGTFFARGGVFVDVDTRRPTFGQGVFASFATAYTEGLPGDLSRYVRVAAAVGGSINLWQGTRFLFLRLALDTVVPVHGQVPFWELPTLGGPDDLRGFRTWRFRDFSTLLFTAEYRWPIWMWADAALFVDVGSMSGARFAGLKLDGLHPDFGLAVRVRTRSRFFFRIQIAYGIGGGLQFAMLGGARP